MWDDSHREKKTSRKTAASHLIFHNKFEEMTGSAFIPKRKYANKALQLTEICLQMYPATFRNLDNGGLYTGASGLLLTLLRLMGCEELKDQAEVIRGQATRLAEASYDFCRRGVEEGSLVSLFFGKGGTYALCAAVFRAVGRETKALECAERFVHGQWACKEMKFSGLGGDELANGRAGYVAGLVWLSKFFTPNEIRLYSLYNILTVMNESGKAERDKLSMAKALPESALSEACTSPIIYTVMGSRYLGMLMGLTGVLQSYLFCPFFLDQYKQAESDVREGVDFILSLQKDDGTFPDKLEDFSEYSATFEEYAQWKTGATGIGFLMAAAFLRWKDAKYYTALQRCVEFTWMKGLSKETFGLGNGIAGSCYLFLIMYRLTNEEIHLHRAVQFINFLVSEKYLGPVLNKKNLENFSLMEGLAGVAVLLIDILKPQDAEFPFLPVFNTINRI